MKTLKIKVILVLALILVQEAIKMRMNLVLEMIIMRVFGLIQPSALLRDALNTILPRKERDVSDKGNSFIHFVPIVLFNSIVLIQFVLFNLYRLFYSICTDYFIQFLPIILFNLYRLICFEPCIRLSTSLHVNILF